MSLEKLQKAVIVAYDINGNVKKEIKVLFNPEQYSLERSNQFANQPIPGQQSPVIQFVRGEAEGLSLDLFFDTYTYYNGEDVRKYTDEISNLLDIDPDIHAPPICSFRWGGPPFDGIIERVSKRFTMFKEDGVPVRATVSVSFKKFPGPKEQKMSKSSPDRTKRRLVKQGDTLWLLAAREYGNPAKWRAIADANKIENPRILKPGMEIIIPPLGK
jgi:contractile injection system tube protein/LysM domain-containing protein